MSDSRLSPGEQIESLWDLGGLSWKALSNRVWHEIEHDDLCLAKTSYARKMNDLAKSSIRTVPIRFLP
jgi:hypothetical protein